MARFAALLAVAFLGTTMVPAWSQQPQPIRVNYPGGNDGTTSFLTPRSGLDVGWLVEGKDDPEPTQLNCVTGERRELELIGYQSADWSKANATFGVNFLKLFGVNLDASSDTIAVVEFLRPRDVILLNAKQAFGAPGCGLSETAQNGQFNYIRRLRLIGDVKVSLMRSKGASVELKTESDFKKFFQITNANVKVSYGDGSITLSQGKDIAIAYRLASVRAQEYSHQLSCNPECAPEVPLFKVQYLGRSDEAAGHKFSVSSFKIKRQVGADLRPLHDIAILTVGGDPYYVTYKGGEFFLQMRKFDAKAGGAEPEIVQVTYSN